MNTRGRIWSSLSIREFHRNKKNQREMEGGKKQLSELQIYFKYCYL